VCNINDNVCNNIMCVILMCEMNRNVCINNINNIININY